MQQMIKKLSVVSLSLMTSLAFASEGQLSAEMSLESFYFFHDAQLENQHNSSLSMTLQPKYRQSWGFDEKVFEAKLFARKDRDDDERSHFDIREFSWTQTLNNFDFKVGISKEFWGVVESHQLVDVINQVDNVEQVDNKARLGQPMLKMSYSNDYGSLDTWILPYFRNRNFASNDSRVFSGPINVDEDAAQYYSSKKEKHVDFAIRYSNNFDDFDIGIGYFQGTSRNPVLKYNQQNNTLYPFYDQLKQLSTDIQWTGDALLLKLEALVRDEASYGHSKAIVTGFEYTFFDLFNGQDIGLIAEYLYDELGKSRTSFDKDLFTGVRYTFNDIDATEILLGGFIDMDDGSQIFRFKLQQRINNDWKYEFIAQSYSNIDPDDLFHAPIQHDDFLRFNLRYYF